MNSKRKCTVCKEIKPIDYDIVVYKRVLYSFQGSETKTKQVVHHMFLCEDCALKYLDFLKTFDEY